MNTAFTIRRARSTDAPGLTSLILRSKQSNGYDDAFMAACADELRVDADDLKHTDYWVAERDMLLGFVRLDVSDSAGQIGAFFIDPDQKRQGIGRTLWNHILEIAKAKGLTRLRLDADPEAVPFYTALGFDVIGQTPSGSIPGRSLPLMELRLPSPCA